MGIVTHRDVRFETNHNQPVSNVMTPQDKLVTVKEGETNENIKKLLHEHRIEKVLVVDDNFGLKGKDLMSMIANKAETTQMPVRLSPRSAM